MQYSSLGVLRHVFGVRYAVSVLVTRKLTLVVVKVQEVTARLKLEVLHRQHQLLQNKGACQRPGRAASRDQCMWIVLRECMS